MGPSARPQPRCVFSPHCLHHLVSELLTYEGLTSAEPQRCALPSSPAVPPSAVVCPILPTTFLWTLVWAPVCPSLGFVQVQCKQIPVRFSNLSGATCLLHRVFTVAGSPQPPSLKRNWGACVGWDASEFCPRPQLSPPSLTLEGRQPSTCCVLCSAPGLFYGALCWLFRIAGWGTQPGSALVPHHAGRRVFLCLASSSACKKTPASH